MTQTKTALYDTRGAAETARDGLISLGITESDISIRGTEDTSGSSMSTSGAENKGFWASLGDLFMPDDDRNTYTEGVRRGGYLLSVRVPDGLENEAEDVMESADPIDLDQRSESWRQEGWSTQGTTAGGGTYAAAGTRGTAGLSDTAATGYSPAAGATTAGAGSTFASRTSDTTAFAGTTGTTGTTGRDDETLQVVEEDLKIGKREIGRGSVRVRSYVTERPVEEDVNLRSERVTIERRPVDREVPVGSAAFQERTIEAVERGEEAVVSKTAHVKEEIALHKDVESHTETVRDTVRSTEVEVDDDRTGHGLTSGTTTSTSGATTDPAYRRDKI